MACAALSGGRVELDDAGWSPPLHHAPSSPKMLERRSCHAQRWRWYPRLSSSVPISRRSTGRHSSTSSAKVVLTRPTRSVWLMFKPDAQMASMISRIAARSSSRMFGAANSRFLSGSVDDPVFFVEPRTSVKVRSRSLTLRARAVAGVMRPNPHSREPFDDNRAG